MPTYEYVCSKCEHHFDIVQPISQKALTVCPKDKCGMKSWGRGPVKRAIGTGGGIIFKGSGFYITDYRSDSYKEAAKKDSSSGAPPAAGDAKPAPKTEAAPKSEAKPPKTKPDGK